MKPLAPISAACIFLGLSTLGHAQAPTPNYPVSASTSGSTSLDFGDFSSATLVNKAWKALEGKDYASVQGYTDKCISMFKDKAVQMQKALTAPPATSDKAAVFANWALNDVGTSYYIQGKADEDQGKTKDAIEAYKFLADNLAYTECWDPKGWFWSPAGAAKERLAALQFDSIK